MGVTYPAPAPTYNGDVLQIHRFLKSPAVVAKRMATLLNRKFIADALLTQRLAVEGGAITYETGDPLGTAENPRAVAPGAEYPLVKIGSGTPQVAKTDKWGQDAEITDESIKRQKIVPVNRALSKLAVQNVTYIDSVAMGVISSAVTATRAASAAWAGADAEQILTDVFLAKADVTSLGEGLEPDVVALDELLYASVLAKFIAAGYLPREAANGPITTGEFPRVNGMLWLPSPQAPSTPIVADSVQLGGMADEDLGGPGYATSSEPGAAKVETKVIRDDDNDKYKARARRVTVPVVLEPMAGIKITGA